MSRQRSKDEYEKTFAFRFFRWLSGSKDPYIGKVEMQVQQETVIPEETITERLSSSVCANRK